MFSPPPKVPSASNAPEMSVIQVRHGIRRLAKADPDVVLAMYRMLEDPAIMEAMGPYLNLPKDAMKLFEVLRTNAKHAEVMLMEERYLQVARLLVDYYNDNFSERRMRAMDPFVTQALLDAFMALQKYDGRSKPEFDPELTQLMEDSCILYGYLGFRIAQAGRDARRGQVAEANTTFRTSRDAVVELMYQDEVIKLLFPWFALRRPVKAFRAWLKEQCQPQIATVLATDFRPGILERRRQRQEEEQLRRDAELARRLQQREAGAQRGFALGNLIPADDDDDAFFPAQMGAPPLVGPFAPIVDADANAVGQFMANLHQGLDIDDEYEPMDDDNVLEPPQPLQRRPLRGRRIDLQRLQGLGRNEAAENVANQVVNAALRGRMEPIDDEFDDEDDLFMDMDNDMDEIYYDNDLDNAMERPNQRLRREIPALFESEDASFNQRIRQELSSSLFDSNNDEPPPPQVPSPIYPRRRLDPRQGRRQIHPRQRPSQNLDSSTDSDNDDM